MRSRCPYCHTPLESPECPLCSTLHHIGLCVRYEKDFLEYEVWPELQRMLYQEFSPQVVAELHDDDDEDEDEDMLIGPDLWESCPLEARVSFMARLWRDYQSVLRQQRHFITRHDPLVLFWAWMPVVVAQRARFQHDAGLQMLFNGMFFLGLRAVVDSVRQGKRDEDIFRAAIAAMQGAFEELPRVHAGWMTMTTDQRAQERQLLSLSGLVSTYISLKPTANLRLYTLLRTEVAADPTLPSLSAALYRRLPGSVLLAWHGTPLTTLEFLQRIRRALVSDGPVEASKNHRRVVPPEHFSLEEMYLQEEAHRALDRVVSTLPTREAAIWDLASQGVPYAEIGQRLQNIKVGTVKATIARVKHKLRNAIRA